MSILRWKRVAGVAVAGMLAAFGPCGCNNDDDPETGELDGYFESHPLVNDPRTTGNAVVSLSPSSAQVNTVGGKVVFTATGGRAPYSWDVSSGAIGRVAGSGSSQGIYTALAVGNNDVIAIDADNNAAIATIAGTVAGVTTLAVSASPVSLPVAGSLSVLKATGGQPPYSWTVGDQTKGTFEGSPTATGASVVYRRGGTAGDNSVTVTDSLGAKASAVINQP